MGRIFSTTSGKRVRSTAVAKATVAPAVQSVVERLEDRAYCTMTVGLRVAGSNATTASVTKVGQVINLQAVATISGTTAGTNDAFVDLIGSFVGTRTSSAGVVGNLAATLLPTFTANGSSNGTQQDLNGDGGLDDGSTSTSANDAEQYVVARSGTEDYSGLVSGDTNTFILATLTYTVTSLGSGGATDLNFVLAPSLAGANSALWIQDGSGVAATSVGTTFKLGTPVVVTGPTTTPTPTPTPTATQVTGTVYGTSGSYGNGGNTIAKAVDDNVNTYFDAPSPNGDAVGIILPAAAAVTQVKFAPRAGWTGRMVGGTFQAADNVTFTSGVVTAYTVTAAPAAGSLTAVAVAAGTHQYWRYVAPNGSYGDIAEFELFTGGTTLAQRTGTTTGTAGSYQNDGNTVAKATDGSPSTFFDGPAANGNVVEIDLGSAESVSTIRYAPRSTYAGRMVGGVFQASNSATFASGVATLYTVTATPAVGVLTTVTLAAPVADRYYRYVAPNGSYGDIAEFELFG